MTSFLHFLGNCLLSIWAALFVVGAVLAYTLVIYARGYSDGSRDTAALCDCKEGS